MKVFIGGQGIILCGNFFGDIRTHKDINSVYDFLEILGYDII